ncbi:MAG: hypothetical protein K2P26_11110 [Oscillospiraceae bacterium]|nr:hypothetical protein [Oscillospiraceae bacterium]MDE6936149.1 hypothetical protein [Oscillospiraceae bacterium]
MNKAPLRQTRRRGACFLQPIQAKQGFAAKSSFLILFSFKKKVCLPQI